MHNVSIFVLDKNESSREIIRLYIENIGISSDIRLYDDFLLGYEDIKQEQNPIVLLDISENVPYLSDILQNIKLYTTKLIITSANYSTNTIIRALKFGAKDILPKPIIKDDLQKALDKVCSDNNSNDEDDSKIITVYSNKGGIGKTTIAINLAIELAKTTKDKVALVDLNLQLGDVSTFLDINPPFSVSYTIKHLLDKDESDFIKGFEKYKNTSLYILADPSYVEQTETVNTQQISALFKKLKTMFQYIVVDMSSNIDAMSLNILDSSDQILFTSIVNIPAIRNAQRCLNLFASRRYSDEKVKIIVNRFMDNDEIKLKDIEETLGKSVYWKIPNNYFTIMEAINKGTSIAEVNTSSNIGNSFRDFANKIAEETLEKFITKNYR